MNALETLNVGRAGLSLSSLALSEDVLDALSSPQVVMMIWLYSVKWARKSLAASASAYESGILNLAAMLAWSLNGKSRTLRFYTELSFTLKVFMEPMPRPQSRCWKEKTRCQNLNIYEGTNEIQRFLILKDLIEQSRKNHNKSYLLQAMRLC